MNSSPLLVRTLRKEKTGKVPFWFMRQAGRYLPEYRELRSKHKNFLEFCYTPDAACEATLQPIRRFGMDAAIIFSDILVIPDALGVQVSFEEGEGPRLSQVTDESYLKGLSINNIPEKLAPVYEAIRQTRRALPADTALIGFAGAPWTLACYMVEGKSSRNFNLVKKIATRDGLFFDRLINLLTRAVVKHLDLQVKAGADAVQLFDSWAGTLGEPGYTNWVVEPTIRIVTEFKKLHPTIPVIGFPRQSGTKFLSFVKETGIDAVNFDDSVPLEWVRDKLQPLCVPQGALDNNLLADNKEDMLKEAKNILAILKGKPFVFNLAHGILPHTPLENVAALCELLKQQP